MIWLLRHGDAEGGEGKPDAERELTDKGRDQARDAGRALVKLGVKIDTCLSSKKVRAKDTAEIACAELGGLEVQEDERLRDREFNPLDIAVEHPGEELLLVGHEPDFSGAVALVTGSRVKLKKGGLAAIDDHVLHALYRPKDLSAIAG
jgi:phosphohistidine phosphatase